MPCYEINYQGMCGIDISNTRRLRHIPRSSHEIKEINIHGGIPNYCIIRAYDCMTETWRNNPNYDRDMAERLYETTIEQRSRSFVC
jgi:hypothetical protein